MDYTVDSSRVAAEVKRFTDAMLKAWTTCLGEIAANPYPRSAYYVDRPIDIAGIPMRTWLYEITQETSVSGEIILVFTAEFFPEYAPVYVVNEEARVVAIIFLRENRRY